VNITPGNISPEIPQLDPLRVQVRKHALMNEISTRPARRWWRLAVPATGLAAAIAIGAVVWPVASPSAFASWSAEPRAPGPDGFASADDCRGKFTEWLTPTDGARESGVVPKPVPTDTSLVDQRGSVTLVMLTGSQTMAYCLYTPTYRTFGLNELSLGDTWFRTNPESHLPDGEPARILTGHVRPEVGRVVVGTADGRQVTATVDKGWVAAWWPSDADASSVTLYDEAGHVLGTQVPENR
jgi:hypothetical protein